MQEQNSNIEPNKEVVTVNNNNESLLQKQQALKLQLLDMGFQISLIQQAIKKSNFNKDKAIQYIITSLQNQEKNIIKQDKTNKSKSKQNINSQQDQEFQDVQQQYKMIFLVRMDLKMGLGKMAAQVAHATLKAFKQIQGKIQSDQNSQIAYFQWIQNGSKKIVLKVNSQKQLMQLYEKALHNKINACYIRDAGLTQIEAGSVTVAALGPAPSTQLDKITQHLKLL